MSEYYFRSKYSALCYPLDYHLANAKDEGLTEIELLKAIPEKVGGFSWCKTLELFLDDGDCGKHCKEYAPKNGKFGMCRHKSRRSYSAGEKVLFKVNYD